MMDKIDDGKNIMQVLKYVEQFYKEIAQVIQKIDTLMEESGWKPAYGNTVTADGSNSLNEPGKWFSYMNFRIYKQKNNPQLIKAVTFYYDWESPEQPMVIVGLVEYKDKKMYKWEDIDYFVLQTLWIDDDTETRKMDGTIYTNFKGNTVKGDKYSKDIIKSVKRAKLFAYNLMDIRDETDIKNKVTDKLIKLK